MRGRTHAAALQTIGELELGLEIWENLVPTTSRLAYGHIYVAAAICMHMLVLYMLILRILPTVNLLYMYVAAF